MNAEHSIPSTHTTELARLVNCLDELAFAALAGVKLTTLEAWRKRGEGPEYVLLGRSYLYPIAAVQAYIDRRVRKRTSIRAKDQLL
ncbi:AlpA family transcriptional regulator [Herbaspirillum sp. SJZ107]|uniref:helix-turn-helix transcriptional regulator n=1 Tax=Herbaspirillum sp. SJZ107 TaxID=2572881 RepID=UPI00116F06BD|nr:helix-turn-helix domain-containing protein [Herbaspirillum sp. SJZ107]TQK10172.1 helix-turn-helix protein [Herbaspirillum sp. SJZ107]